MCAYICRCQCSPQHSNCVFLGGDIINGLRPTVAIVRHYDTNKFPSQRTISQPKAVMQGRPRASQALSVVGRMSFRVEVLRVVRVALTRLARDQTPENGNSGMKVSKKLKSTRIWSMRRDRSRGCWRIERKRLCVLSAHVGRQMSGPRIGFNHAGHIVQLYK